MICMISGTDSSTIAIGTQELLDVVGIPFVVYDILRIH